MTWVIAMFDRWMSEAHEAMQHDANAMVVSTVGAGDSSLFGYLLGDIRGLPAPERLALAVAYGSAAAGLPGTTIPQPSQLRTELVAVTALTPSTGGTA